MSGPYEIRSNDNGKSKKQSMAELKLRRLTELNQRLQEDLNRRRIPVSEAALECVSHCGQHHLLTLCYTCGTPF
jgi:guanine nucleotide-binding protein subunit gamma